MNSESSAYALFRPRKNRGRESLILLVAAGAVILAGGARAGEIEIQRFVQPAAITFEQGQGAWDVKLDESGAAVLYDRVLVEDDGPGISSDASWLQTDRAPTTDITGDTRVKKVLHLDRLGARQARLCVPTGVSIEINGRSLGAPSESPAPEIPVAWLKPGENEIVLSRPSGKPQSIKSALREDILRNAPERRGQPHRSFKSEDGGKNWLPIEGEYLVRLHLIQSVPRGHFISPVLDLGQRDLSPLLAPVSVQSISASARAETPAGTRVELALRTGPTPVYAEGVWSDWQAVGAAAPKENRYLQWRATLISDDASTTPRLRSVAIEAQVSRPSAPAWAGGLRVASFHNEELRHTSWPFEYENPLHPRLVALRQKFKLDEVVAGAKTETEQLARLRHWVAGQWQYSPPALHYPAWDADEILTRKYGFCVQYAIAFMQCALSLGHQARFVFGYNPGAFDGGGHEVCEFWSNEHRKWIFFDINQDWHFLDARTGVPHSMLEMHDLALRTYYGNQPAAFATPPARRLPDETLALCFGTNLIPGVPPKNFEIPYVDGFCTVPTRWLFINYMPRNNFFAKPYPQPKTQGAHWDWSDYACWEDAQTPQRWLYRHFTARRNDLDWTLNQVRFDATPTDQAGNLALHLGTVTPFLDTFLIKADQAAWKTTAASFSWPLHPGRNRLEMRVRTQAGIQGPVSFIEVQFEPEKADARSKAASSSP